MQALLARTPAPSRLHALAEALQPVCLRNFRGCAAPGAPPDDEGKIIYDATSSEVEELIESNLDKKTYRRREDDTPARVLTTRREALSLYREVLRWSLLFVWKDDKGRRWRDVIRDSARREFESARFEDDPEIINRLLIGGRDCVQQVKDRFVQQRQRIIEDEVKRHEQGGPPRPPPPDGPAWPGTPFQ